MIKLLLKWAAPGVFMVLGGTVAAVATTHSAIVEDLQSRAAISLRAGGMETARVQVDGRDIHVSATVADPTERDAAIAHLAMLPGVRSVTDAVLVAPIAAPFLFNVLVEDGAVSLSGSVPNSSQLARLHALPAVGTAGLSINAGGPDPQVWGDAVDFALHQARFLERGQLQIAGLTLSGQGDASSPRALGELELAQAPDGVTLAGLRFAPMVADPFEWSAVFDGDRITLSGHVPDEHLVERYRLADLSGHAVATALTLASGAPDDFERTSRLLLEQLPMLEYGTATMSGTRYRLTGQPPTIEVAQAVAQNLSGTGSIVELSPPPVADYWVSVTRQEGGVLVFDGFAPDAAARDAFGALDNADVSWLKLGTGAPTFYQAATGFGLSLLDRMSEGRIALRGNVLTVKGIAADATEFRTLRNTLSDEVPAGIVLAMAEIEAPAVDPYQFSVTRQTGGNVVLSGYVPDPDVETQLLAEAGRQAASTLRFGSGEPLNFAASALQAVDFLQWLDAGEIRLDGTQWLVSGTPASAIARAAIETEFTVRDLPRAGWSLALAEAAAAPQPVSPYLWSAERLANGSYIFSGNVPAGALKSYLNVRAAGRVTDNSRVSPGAPPDFDVETVAALDILALVSTGKASFDGSAWQIEGQGLAADSPGAAADVIGSLDPARWQLDIQAPVVAEVPAPDPVEAEAAPVAAAPVATPEPMAVDVSQCRDTVNSLSSQNAILFQSGAAIIAESAYPMLDSLAQALALCAQAPVHIEGHTDSDGDDRLNLALSVARAEAVVNALIERGVAPERLYAIGYGESQPVADNSTAQGKSQNRRIVVSVDTPVE